MIIGGEKKSTPGIGFNKFRDRSTPSLSVDGHGRALNAALSSAATPEAFTRTRTQAHHSNQRGLPYMRVGVVSRRRDSICVLGATLGEAHFCLEVAQRQDLFAHLAG